MLRLGFAAAFVAIATAIGATVASADDPPAPSPGVPKTGVETYTYDKPLKNAKTEEQEGSADPAGHCNFGPLPPLSMAHGAPPVERRPVAMDHDKCIATYETGEPTELPTESAGGTSLTETEPRKSRPVTKAGSVVNRLAATGSNAFAVIWQDIIHADVNRTEPRIQWGTTSQCVYLTGSGSSAYWWWLSGTGWWKDSSDWSTSTSRSGACTGSYGWWWKTHARGTFKNGFVCGWVVTVDVTNAWVQAALAAVSGSVQSTSSTFSCAPLHHHQVLY